MNPVYFNSPRELAQAVPMPINTETFAALGYSTLLVGAGILAGALMGAGWGFLTKRGPSTQDFVTGAIGGAGVGVGMLIAQALRGRI